MFKKLINVGVFAVVQFFLSVIINYYLAKIVSPADYGIYFYILSITQFISTFLLFGLSSTVVRYYESIFSKEKVEKYLRNTLPIISIFYFVILLLSYLLNLSEFFFKEQGSLMWLIVLVQVPFIFENQLSTSFYWSKNNFIKRGIFTNIFNFLQVLFIVLIFYKVINLNIFYTIIISRLLNTIIVLFFIKKDFNLNYHIPEFDRKVFKENDYKIFITFGLWNLLSTLSLLLIDFVDRFVITNYLDAKYLGYYQAVYSLFSYFYMPFQLLANVFLSFYLKKWNEDKYFVINKIQNITLFALLLYVIVSTVFVLNNKFIISTFFNKDFLHFSEKGLLLFSLVFLLKIIYSLIGCLSFISNNPKFLTKALLSSTILSVVLDFLLVKYYKLDGILYSSLIAYILLLLILYIQYFKQGIVFKKYFILSILSIFFLISIIYYI